MAARVVTADRDALVRQVASRLADALCEVVAVRGTVGFGLGTGGVSCAIAHNLASRPGRHRVPWTRIEIFPIDECCVPPTDPRSRFRQISDALVGGEHSPAADGRLPAPVQPLAFHRPHGEAGDRDEAARRYAEQLPEALDVLLLEVRTDGSVASLVPHQRGLTNFDTRAVSVHVDRPPRARLTITPPVIAAARELIVVASGLGVAEVVARCLEGPWAPAALPAQLARHGTWYLDVEAASALQPGRPAAVRAWRH